MCFFFQAEDGIRDLVRSRGLGDVYKRQEYGHNDGHEKERDQVFVIHDGVPRLGGIPGEHGPVSYTHLTLPTIYPV